MKNIVVITLLCQLSAATAYAQVSTREVGRGYFNLSAQFQGSDAFFGSNGQRRTGRNLDQLIISTYGEVGLIERWLTLTLSGDLLRQNTLTDLGTTRGLGDLRVGALTEWWRIGSVRLLSGLHFGLPTGDPEPSGGSDDVSELVARSLPTGDGEFDIEPSLRLTGQLDFEDYPLRHYWIVSGGYWIRTDGFVDAVTYGAELGTQVASPGWDRVWLIVRSRGVEALESVDQSSSGGIGVGNGISFTVLGAEAQVRLPAGFSLGVGAEAPLQGQGILDAVAVKSLLGFEF